MVVGIVKLMIGKPNWRSVWSQSVETPSQPAKNVVYHVCNRHFRRECDKTRHRCTVERSKQPL